MRDEWREIGSSAVSFGPHAGAHRVALRAAVCVAVPLLILWGIDRLDVSVFATFGAFTALYGRFDALRDRLAMQTAAGATIVVTMVIATALAAANSPAVAVLGGVLLRQRASRT